LIAFDVYIEELCRAAPATVLPLLGVTFSEYKQSIFQLSLIDKSEKKIYP
jgi:hypothetical protein